MRGSEKMGEVMFFEISFEEMEMFLFSIIFSGMSRLAITNFIA
jgi:hypothetical protein